MGSSVYYYWACSHVQKGTHTYTQWKSEKVSIIVARSVE